MTDPVSRLGEIRARQGRLPLEHHVETFREDAPPNRVGWHCLTCNEQAHVEAAAGLSWQVATAEAAGAEHSKSALVAHARADVGWLLEHIEQQALDLHARDEAYRLCHQQHEDLRAEITRRDTPWQAADLWGRMSAADPEIREALIQAWNERDRLEAQRQAMLDLCDKRCLNQHCEDCYDMVRVIDVRAALGG